MHKFATVYQAAMRKQSSALVMPDVRVVDLLAGSQSGAPKELRDAAVGRMAMGAAGGAGAGGVVGLGLGGVTGALAARGMSPAKRLAVILALAGTGGILGAGGGALYGAYRAGNQPIATKIQLV